MDTRDELYNCFLEVLVEMRDEGMTVRDITSEDIEDYAETLTERTLEIVDPPRIVSDHPYIGKSADG